MAGPVGIAIGVLTTAAEEVTGIDPDRIGQALLHGKSLGAAIAGPAGPATPQSPSPRNRVPATAHASPSPRRVTQGNRGATEARRRQSPGRRRSWADGTRAMRPEQCTRGLFTARCARRAGAGELYAAQAAYAARVADALTRRGRRPRWRSRAFRDRAPPGHGLQETVTINAITDIPGEGLTRNLEAGTGVALCRHPRGRARLGEQCAPDYLADTVAGAKDPPALLLGGDVRNGGDPAATVVAHTRDCPSLSAAIVNGAASHALDFDDVNMVMPGHPSVAIIPGLLALAEQRGAVGRMC